MSYLDGLERPRARHIASGAKWLIGLGLLFLVVAMLLASMSIFGWGFFQRATADFRGTTAELEQVKADPAHRISAREYFFQTCASVQAHEDTVAILEDELAGDVSDEREEQLNGAVAANMAQRANLIRQYNGSAQNFTFEQFRDAQLPDHLDVAAERTLCVAGDR